MILVRRLSLLPAPASAEAVLICVCGIVSIQVRSYAGDDRRRLDRPLSPCLAGMIWIKFPRVRGRHRLAQAWAQLQNGPSVSPERVAQVSEPEHGGP